MKKDDPNEVIFIEGSSYEIELKIIDIDKSRTLPNPTFEILKKGRVIHSFKTEPSDLFSFNLSFLESGTYAYRFVNTGKVIQAGKINILPVYKSTK